MNILITGAAGHIGGRLRADLAGRYGLIRLFDQTAITDLAPGEEAVTGDIADMAAVEAAMQGIDGVIHLAAMPVEASFEVILHANVVGTWNVYEAARRQGAKRIVFGSSNHAVGFYPRTQHIDETVLPRPDSRYGLSKSWGEAVSALYADKYDVTTLNIRIGNAAEVPGTARALAIWVSRRDLAQLMILGLEHPDIHCDIVYGVSRNSACWYDNSAAYRLGYVPQDRSEDHTEAAMAGEAQVTQDAVALHFQGGPFCSIEYAGRPVPPAEG